MGSVKVQQKIVLYEGLTGVPVELFGIRQECLCPSRVPREQSVCGVHRELLSVAVDCVEFTGYCRLH